MSSKEGLVTRFCPDGATQTGGEGAADVVDGAALDVVEVDDGIGDSVVAEVLDVVDDGTAEVEGASLVVDDGATEVEGTSLVVDELEVVDDAASEVDEDDKTGGSEVVVVV